MSVSLLRTNAAIEDCERHLESTESYGTEIESYLTQHILVLFCAEIQQEIYKMLNERASFSGDEGIRQFVAASAPMILRSVQKDHLANLAALFGQDAKEQFNSMLDDKDVTSYNNAVRDRHDVAHKHGAQVSFEEVRKAVESAIRILESLRMVIYLSVAGSHKAST